MRTYIFASIAGISGLALAADVEVTRGAPTNLESTKSGKVGSAGEVGEVMLARTDENGNELKEIWLYARWTTGTTDRRSIWDSGYRV